jgi:hypothetical protein
MVAQPSARHGFRHSDAQSAMLPFASLLTLSTTTPEPFKGILDLDPVAG